MLLGRSGRVADSVSYETPIIAKGCDIAPFYTSSEESELKKAKFLMGKIRECYPNLYFLIRDIFGIQLSGLQLVNTFGFFVALAFIGSGFVLYSELKRKEQLGEFKAIEEEITICAPATWGELATSLVFGFLFGYKLIGAFLIENALSNPQLYILSTQGKLS